jgi:hypothetical protein
MILFGYTLQSLHILARDPHLYFTFGFRSSLRIQSSQANSFHSSNVTLHLSITEGPVYIEGHRISRKANVETYPSYASPSHVPFSPKNPPPRFFAMGITILSWVILVGLSYLLTVVIYRTLLSPLTKIPGPKLAVMTQGYEMYYNLIKKARFPWQLQKLHDVYGKTRFITQPISIYTI